MRSQLRDRRVHVAHAERQVLHPVPVRLHVPLHLIPHRPAPRRLCEDEVDAPLSHHDRLAPFQPGGRVAHRPAAHAHGVLVPPRPLVGVVHVKEDVVDPPHRHRVPL